MTLRSTFLLFAALLLLASLVGAATPGQGVTPAFMTPAAPAAAGGSCNPLLAKLRISLLDSAKDTTVGIGCGICSDAVCQGAPTNEVCGRQGAAIKKCVPLLGDLCPQDNKFNCTCYYGPIP
jgi:hypothetical protein